MNSLRTTLLVVAVALSFSTIVHAGPPYTTDDPEPVAYRHWEVYSGTGHERTPDGSAGTAPFLEVNYGAAENVHLHVIVPFVYSRPTGGPGTYGLGDIELGTKLRFIQEGKRVPMVGTFPLLELPAGSKEKGLGSGHVRAFLPIWIQKSFGPWTTYGGGGYRLNPGDGNRNFWFVGWQVQRHLSNRLALGGEVFHTTADSIDSVGISRFNAGLVLDLTKTQHLLFSAGHTFSGPSQFQGYLAYQLTF